MKVKMYLNMMISAGLIFFYAIKIHAYIDFFPTFTTSNYY